MENKLFERLVSHALSLGAYRAAVIPVEKIETDASFRSLCEANMCGNYGRNWMCPPYAGEIGELMARLRTYSYALVYQTVSELEDSYDFEGMMEAGARHNKLMPELRKELEEEPLERVLHLGAGGCRVCEKCAKRDDEPCRHPELATASLETYGVNVSRLAEAAGMKYINGKDTVTYFGAVLFDLNDGITVTVDGKKATAKTGDLISEIVRGEKPCGGHGKCGKCKVVAQGALSEIGDAERRLLTESEIARGVRLACMTYALGDCCVETLQASDPARILTDTGKAVREIAPSFSRFGVAVDVGTTTLAATLFDINGDRLASVSRLNPQSRWGADVVSRIESSMQGERRALAAAIREAIGGMVCSLAEAGGIDADEIDGVVITGNTVMLTLLCEGDTEPFSHAPFAVDRLFGETLSAKELGITSLSESARVYLPPCIAAFVGADTVCAILATGLLERDTAMLADIGTNGEIALCNKGKLKVCSTAAGPAFEGVGISVGMRGEVGAIDKVSLVGDRLFCHTIGEVEPKGVCGSGLVDAVACMLDLEVLDESGYLEDDPYPLGGGVSLTQKDIRAVQLAKSAICAGICALAASERVRLSEVGALCIAGGFGNYLNMRSSVAIGLLPEELSGKIEVCGNAALAGAEMLLLNRALRDNAQELAGNAEALELATDPIFVEKYMMGMLFGQ